VKALGVLGGSLLAADRSPGRAARRVANLWHYRSPAARRPRAALRYLLRGRELTNFTYDIANEAELARLVADALELPSEEVEATLREVAQDEQFLAELRSRLRARADRADEPRFGRRLGWYCIVRATRPRVIVETGSHDGLGTALLARALQRNREEGAPGVLLSFDIDPASGWLVGEPLRAYVERHIGDARETLPAALAGREVGVFVHDSLHTYEHERFELETAVEHAAERLVLISDNAHVSPALLDVCRERGMRYVVFRERSLDHFYPGAGMGLGLYSRAAAGSAPAT
jgi:predicted O-methyltransferase YrrM